MAKVWRALGRPIIGPIKRAVARKIDRKVQRATGLVPYGEFNPEDIFIAGYPKSGNTWFQNIVASGVYRIIPRFAPDALVEDIIPDVHSGRFYKRYATPTYFKTHFLPRPEYKNVVYLLRDGRDVMVSYFHHLSAINHSAIDFFEMVGSGQGLFPCKWHEHVEAWLNNPYQARMIVMKYEDMKKDPVHEIGRLFQFIGIKNDVSFLETVAQETCFERMRQQERQHGYLHPQWSMEKRFVRRGIVGSHKDEMPEDVLQAFMQYAEPTLKRCGYL